MAAVDDGLDAHARDADAAAHRQRAQLEQVQADAAQGGVADGAAAEGEVEPAEVRAAEREDLGGRVREGAAEGLRPKNRALARVRSMDFFPFFFLFLREGG